MEKNRSQPSQLVKKKFEDAEQELMKAQKLQKMSVAKKLQDMEAARAKSFFIKSKYKVRKYKYKVYFKIEYNS